MSASRRQSLTDLIPSKTTQAAAPAPLAPPVFATQPTPPTAGSVAPLPVAPEPGPAAALPQPSTESAAPVVRRRPAKQAGPKYLQLERKEVRITAGQYDQLTALARRLNRQRPRGGGSDGERRERITENTLIRVAIELLLAKQPQLAGATEEDLLNSVQS
jgi:hypothetical protein